MLWSCLCFSRYILLFFLFSFLVYIFFFEFCCLLLFLIKHFATIFGVHLALRRFRSPWRLRSTRRWLLAGNILRLSICVDVWCISWSLAERRHQAISCTSSYYYVCTRVFAYKALYVFVYIIVNCCLLCRWKSIVLRCHIVLCMAFALWVALHSATYIFIAEANGRKLVSWVC